MPALLLGIGFGLAPFARGAGIPLAAVGIAGLVIVFGASAALRNVFAVALYRYAVDGEPTGGFAEPDLRDPFTTKRTTFRRPRA